MPSCLDKASFGGDLACPGGLRGYAALSQFTGRSRAYSFRFEPSPFYVKEKPVLCTGFSFGVPGRVRTSGLRSRSPTLYPAELRAHLNLPAHFCRQFLIIYAFFKSVKSFLQHFR